MENSDHSGTVSVNTAIHYIVASLYQLQHAITVYECTCMLVLLQRVSFLCMSGERNWKMKSRLHHCLSKEKHFKEPWHSWHTCSSMHRYTQSCSFMLISYTILLYTHCCFLIRRHVTAEIYNLQILQKIYIWNKIMSKKICLGQCESVPVGVSMCVVGQSISLSHLLLLAESNPDEPKPPPFPRPEIHQPTCHSRPGGGGARNDNVAAIFLSSSCNF